MFVVPNELSSVFERTEVIVPRDRAHLLDITFFESDADFVEVAYPLPDGREHVEATVARCKNGAAVNFTEPYMRRRDPEAMVIADERPSDKRRYSDRFGESFDRTRADTFEWLAQQDRLVVLPFMSGDYQRGYPTLLVAPYNAGFFIAGLADLQGFIPRDEVPKSFTPSALIYLAPPFRHTHFDGRQVVVHNRREGMHELFAYNLYPGPSAKKGVYGILLNKGEEEGWNTLHSSAVRLITPYDNEFTIMHEGASGGGKSEMTQAIHRETDGRILLARNTVTDERLFLELLDTCELKPVTDDMALAPPYLQQDPKTQENQQKLVIEDAESGWFLRVDHLAEYGTEPYLEKLTINPPEPLIFLNIDGKPGATCLLWEHTMDAPGKPCPNPRVILPRHFEPSTVHGPVEIDVRSFGVRTPPCTSKQPNYGIMGMLHILPPALAWLWRLVAPRGHSNPSIVTTEGLSSEGVGSYWPFATGRMVDQANLLLKTITETPRTRFVLIPNQYIGAYHVGFKPEWIAREYIARRGSVRFREGRIKEARCPLLGYTLPALKVNGQQIPRGLLEVDEQLEVGSAGYDAGAQILTDFFKKELENFLSPELDPTGRHIIEMCMDNAPVSAYAEVMGDSFYR